jgi:hypothetical protein
MPWPGVAYELLPEVAGGKPLPLSSHGGYRASPPITSRVACANLECHQQVGVAELHPSLPLATLDAPLGVAGGCTRPAQVSSNHDNPKMF